jgi:3-hydroxyisobutyrate dehydrogenase
VQNVALLGLGTMGAGMADQLLLGGLSLTVWNRTREWAEVFADRGATVAASPRAAAAATEIVISMVADDQASRAVWYGENGALGGAKPGSILIEASTLSPVWIRELASAAAEHKSDFLDAPVTGSKEQAATGELLFMVGGDRAVFERAFPVLKVMSKAVVHLGPTGSGSLMKLINNFVCGVQAATLAEAFAFIEKSGLDREQALQILTGGAPGSPLVKAVSARMSARDYTVNFMLDLMCKDLSYASAEATRQGLNLSMASVARELFNKASTLGFGKLDFSALIESLRVDQSDSTASKL